MASVIPFPRSLGSVTTELSIVRQRIAVLHALPTLTSQEDGDLAALEQRRLALEDEADTLFFRATGVSWSLYQRVRA